MNIIDIIVLGIIVLMFIKGMRKGLVSTVFEMASFLAAGICAIIYRSAVSKFLMGTRIFEWIHNNVSKYVTVANNAAVQTSVSTDSANAAYSIMDSLQLPAFIKKLLLQNSSDGFGGIIDANALSDSITSNVSSFIISILSVLLIFIGVKLALQIVCSILNGMMSMPLLNAANKISGGLFGAVNGIIVVYIICAILVLFAPMKVFNPIVKLINESAIAKTFYNNNILLQFLFK